MPSYIIYNLQKKKLEEKDYRNMEDRESQADLYDITEWALNMQQRIDLIEEKLDKKADQNED